MTHQKDIETVCLLTSNLTPSGKDKVIRILAGLTLMNYSLSNLVTAVVDDLADLDRDPAPTWPGKVTGTKTGRVESDRPNLLNGPLLTSMPFANVRDYGTGAIIRVVDEGTYRRYLGEIGDPEDNGSGGDGLAPGFSYGGGIGGRDVYLSKI